MDNLFVTLTVYGLVELVFFLEQKTKSKGHTKSNQTSGSICRQVKSLKTNSSFCCQLLKNQLIASFLCFLVQFKQNIKQVLYLELFVCSYICQTTVRFLFGARNFCSARKIFLVNFERKIFVLRQKFLQRAQRFCCAREIFVVRLVRETFSLVR